MIRLLALGAALLLTAASPVAWLDAKTLPTWNTSATLPARTGAADPQLAKSGRCYDSTRPATSPEDRQLIARGWSLVGPYQRYGATVIVTGMGGVDGMCRPEAFQTFVFVGGAFAGTLSPKLMNAREDASIASLGVSLYNASDFAADFARYSADDPLCCPHATTTVMYEIKTVNGRPRVVADSAATQKNPQ
jgi:hypothetical protein